MFMPFCTTEYFSNSVAPVVMLVFLQEVLTGCVAILIQNVDAFKVIAVNFYTLVKVNHLAL